MKVLIVSHNCFSTYNNMGITFCSLFSEFRKEELCQLYIYPSLPDVDVCNSYYRITDKEILRSIVAFRTPGGRLDTAQLTFGQPAAFEHAEDAALYRRQGNSSPIVRSLRDAMWKVSRWYTPRLKQWIEQEKPTCIFLAPGYAKFIYDVAMRISKDYSLPIVTYICDDYYFLKAPRTLSGRLGQSALRRKTDRLMARTSHLVAICDEIKDCYSRKFGLEASVIMTGSDMEKQPRSQSVRSPAVISYLGNIQRNRFTSLADIGRALDEIGQRTGMRAFLDIYTSETDPQILGHFDGIGSIRIRDFVSGEKFLQVFRDSDFLLHTEAFDEENADLVKHSVSTKIADSLASGVPLIAYGPKDIASIRHLIRNDCAFVATSRDELSAMLERALSSPKERARIAENAADAAEKFHNKQRNGALLYELLGNV